MAFKNYYEILEIAPFADPEIAKTAFRQLARKYHPDVNINNPKAEEKFKEINEAYDLLSNKERKAVYDESLKIILGKKPSPQKEKTKQKKEKPKQSPPKDKKKDPQGQKQAQQKEASKQEKKEGASSGTTRPIQDLFDTFLNREPNKKDTAQSQEPKTHRHQDKKKEDTFKGASKADKENFAQSTQKSKSLRGQDVTVETFISVQEAEQGTVKTVNVEHREYCRRCSGTGKIAGNTCNDCHGEKMMNRTKKLDVRIPGGVKTGSKVRVSGEGGRGIEGGEDGDLYLAIQVETDKSLKITGLNVQCDVLISPVDAVLGTEIDVPSLNGPVKLSIPAGTSSGKVLRMKGLGKQSGSQKGDQLVTIQIKTPENLSAEEKELYEKLKKLQK